VAQRGTHIDGFVLVDKPAGMSSFSVVRKTQRTLDAAKAGHAGTLDPFATGLVLVLLGRATRLMQWAVGHDKRYDVEITLGASSTTDDITGELTPVRDAGDVTRDQVAAALAEIAAWETQVPPAVSALHIDGVRAYKRVRRGETIEVAPRPVVIHSIELVDYRQADGVLSVRIHSGSGAYMRSIARDLGELLGTGGYASALRRLTVGEHDIADAVQPEAATLDNVRSMLDVVPELQRIEIDGEAAVAFASGRSGPVPDIASESPLGVLGPDGLQLGIGLVEAGSLSPQMVFVGGPQELHGEVSS
jgi:tRNA pseudouridine55 synthase